MTEQDAFSHPVRVYYEDTDVGGVVYYANYLKFAERARTEALRTLGIDQSDLMAQERVAFAVRECHAEYLKPAHLDDHLMIETRVARMGGASLTMAQRVRRADEVLVEMTVRLACMNVDTGTPVRLPSRVRDYFRPDTGAVSSGL